jgi:hypothetical protein
VKAFLDWLLKRTPVNTSVLFGNPLRDDEKEWAEMREMREKLHELRIQLERVTEKEHLP